MTSHPLVKEDGFFICLAGSIVYHISCLAYKFVSFYCIMIMNKAMTSKGHSNTAKLGHTKDGSIKIEYTSTVKIE